MKALILTSPGVPDIAVQDVKEILGITAEPRKECAVFSAKSIVQLGELCYKSQSANKVLLVVSEGAFPELSIPAEYRKGTVRIEGKSTTKAQELAENLGVKISYKNPDVPFYLHFEDEYYWLGIDLAGRDLGKRDYRIFVGRERLNAISSYALLRMAGYDGKQVLLDPFCRAGSIVIEAALFATRKSPQFFSKDKLWFKNAKILGEDWEKHFATWDKGVQEPKGKTIAIDPNFRGVQATRKNAQIAGVLPALTLSRTETEWLDIKLGKEAVDCIATQPPEPSAATPKVEKLYEQLFANAKILLKKNGVIACILQKDTQLLEKHAATAGFAITHKRTILQGKEAWTVVVFQS